MSCSCFCHHNHHKMSTRNLELAVRLGVTSIILNSLFGVFKIVFGIILGYTSIITDGVHSFTDVLCSIVAVISIKIAARPRDDKYNYGYERYSSIASVVVASMLFTIGMSILVESIHGLIEADYSTVNKASMDALFITSLVILVVSIVMKCFMFIMMLYSSKLVNNDAMKLDSFHQLIDALSSVFAIASMVSSLYGIKYLDYIFSILIVFMIVKVSYEVGSKGIHELSDKSVSIEQKEEIESFLKEHFPNVCFSNLITRVFAEMFYMEIEIDFDSDNVNFKEAIELSKDVKKELLDHFEALKDVTITFKAYGMDNCHIKNDEETSNDVSSSVK